ncbi:MAG: hypothetical protein Q9179_001090 [Wetmoreana sp. 5 TL-2023]
MQSKLFAPADEAHLVKCGLLTDVSDGKRMVSKSIFTPPSSSSTANSGISMLDNISDSEPPSLEVPDFLISQSTYEIMGFSRVKSAELWLAYQEYWEEFGKWGRHDFLSFALDYVDDSSVEDVGGTLGDWRGCLSDLGISERLKNSLLNDEYADIRLTATAKHWVMEALTDQYEGLEDILKESRKRETFLQQLPEGQNSSTPEYRQISQGTAPSVATGYQIPSVNVPDYTTLYKGTTKAKATRFLNPQTGDLSFVEIQRNGAEYGTMRDSHEVTRDHALVVDGQVAIQYVFSGDEDIQAMLEDACRGHVTIHLNPPKRDL